MNFYYKLKGKLEVLKEVFLFLPTLFKIRPWDYSSIFIILEHWLKRMERVHRQDSFHLHADKYAKQIHTCVLLLKRINVDTYTAFDDYEKKWGTLITWFTPTEDKNYSLFNSKRENVKTEEDKKEELREFKYCIRHETYQRTQDINYLFHLINRNHKHWWT